MLECSFAKEPFDLRLMALRLLKKTWLIAGVTLLGILVFGGGYYLKNIALAEELYGATSIYYVAYNKDPIASNAYTYINTETWNTWVHTDDFIEDMQKELDTICREEGLETPDLSRDDIEVYMSANLPTDNKMPYSTAATPDPELSLLIARAAEKSFVNFGERQREIDYIEVVDAAQKAEKIEPDARPLRACILSGVLTLFLTLIVLMLYETGQAGIWLPVTLTNRYGLKAVGAVGAHGIVRLWKGKKKKDRIFEENIKYLFGGMEKPVVTAAVDLVDLDQVTEVLRDCEAECGLPDHKNAPSGWLAVPGSDLAAEGCEKLREADGILLVVKAGTHAAKQLETVLQYLQTQDCHVTAALLWDADEKLIRRYYFGGQGV